MISPNIQKNVETVLKQWLSIFKINKDYYPTYQGHFLSSISTINNDIIIPIYTLVSLSSSPIYNLSKIKNIQTKLCKKSKYIVNCKTITVVLNTCREALNLEKIRFKDNIYIIGKGCIFDEDMNPLLIMSLSAKNFTHKGMKFTIFHTPILHISPRALNDRVLNKYIINYFIPECNKEVGIGLFNEVGIVKDRKRTQKIIVQIHDLGGFIKKCPIPNFTDNVTEKVNSVLQSVKEIPKII